MKPAGDTAMAPNPRKETHSTRSLARLAQTRQIIRSTSTFAEYTREYEIEKTMLNVPDYVLEEEETIRMDNKVSVDEEGELRCSDFEVPLFTSETFIDLFLLHLKNLTQELTEYTREYKIEKTMLNVPDYVLEEDETIRMDNKSRIMFCQSDDAMTSRPQHDINGSCCGPNNNNNNNNVVDAIRANMTPASRLTFRRRDWREAQQPGVRIHAKNGSRRQCVMDAHAVPSVCSIAGFHEAGIKCKDTTLE
ncbi:hypothetical protein E3U43_012631 [Larimichthys crocea]|uniref:Uncharacterized protein n=1 Tax=Larimichthys crocea TaxID=215358 RepID=A0ACD3RTS1_LARCR|nr:hypothetical protein E3U43_012631 [Larimichthys crocea]